MLINKINASAKSINLIDWNIAKLKNCGKDFMPMVNSITTTPTKNNPNPTFEIEPDADKYFLLINNPIRKQLVKPKNERCK